MLLTLPFEMSARVAAAPSVVMLINGKCVAGFTVSEPEHAEIPAVVVAHCSRCRLTGDLLCVPASPLTAPLVLERLPDA